ncbi:hypothetical protein HK102_002620 [Quaeritorhiza haematococci]|nr:hypothetical protein HK102_002620 [Quaeritorhiza haematococci]
MRMSTPSDYGNAVDNNNRPSVGPDVVTYRFLALDNAATDRAMYTSAAAGRRCLLTLRQQPKHSRMCGLGEKVDRRPIDPPPVIQLDIQDENPNTNEKNYFDDNPYFFMYASLISPTTDQELRLLRDGSTRTTAGSTVSPLYRLKDAEYREGAFFVFPDLSIRMEGRYRLKFTLFEIVGSQIRYRASVFSEVFDVYPAKKFPGMAESTPLSRAFAEQGLRIRIRKEPHARRTRKKRSPESERDSSNEREGKKLAKHKHSRKDDGGGVGRRNRRKGNYSDDEGSDSEMSNYRMEEEAKSRYNASGHAGYGYPGGEGDARSRGSAMDWRGYPGAPNQTPYPNAGPLDRPPYVGYPSREMASSFEAHWTSDPRVNREYPEAWARPNNRQDGYNMADSYSRMSISTHQMPASYGGASYGGANMLGPHSSQPLSSDSYAAVKSEDGQRRSDQPNYNDGLLNNVARPGGLAPYQQQQQQPPYTSSSARPVLPASTSSQAYPPASQATSHRNQPALLPRPPRTSPLYVQLPSAGQTGQGDEGRTSMLPPFSPTTPTSASSNGSRGSDVVMNSHYYPQGHADIRPGAQPDMRLHNQQNPQYLPMQHSAPPQQPTSPTYSQSLPSPQNYPNMPYDSHHQYGNRQQQPQPAHAQRYFYESKGNRQASAAQPYDHGPSYPYHQPQQMSNTVSMQNQHHSQFATRPQQL